jgi:threonine dehydrogenase-like Zn-dependent dehydrogenase
MRALVAIDGALRIESLDDPVPERDQVLVSSLVNGICGSDLHLLERQRHGDPRLAGHRVIPGHEFCVEVVDHGPGTDPSVRSRWPVGTRACANPFVESGVHVGGSPDHPGGLGELMVLDPRRMLAVPDQVSPEAAALTEPLAVGIRAVEAARRRSADGPAVVLGCGPIGLAVILALKASGIGPIVASDPAPARRALASRLGAEVVVAPDERSPFEPLDALGFREDPASVMLDDGEVSGVTVFECVGQPGMLAGAVAAAPRHSHVVVVGVCLRPDEFVPGLAVARELSIDFVLAYRPSELAESLRRIGEGIVDPAPLVTATVGLDDAPEAFEQLRRGEQVKVLVRPGGSTA